ncbi:MAG TPA: phosphorylase [Desulfurivibrio alkaliphilus]|uniref:Uridine phosphorylase n=1 Tax=Desulfurivibrio alkaliphilus TaxID=427923 RepID=A0A7C2X9B2_9BACT|nr:phosphorylase [Desulfurivibrio alkaliphilus]
MGDGGEERVVITPRRSPGEPVLAGPGLLLVNPAEAGAGISLAQTAGWRRQRLFHSNLWHNQAGAGWLAGPAVGSPMAVLCLEKLIALGAGPVIALGWAGGLAPYLALGDIVLPTSALSEEGTSRHYPLPEPPLPAEGLLTSLERVLATAALPFRRGAVWTTDAPYRETMAKVEKYRQAGICAVEMEYAALATVAAFRGVELVELLLISDLVRPDYPWQPAFNRKEFRRRSRALLELLFHFIRRGEF